MNYFKLTEERVSFDNGHYVFQPIKWHKKVTSTTFPNLIGKNKYQSKGNAILERSNLLRKDSIDPYYTFRGELAERFVFAYLYDLGLNYQLVTWNAEEEQYDNFKGNPKFGGLIDIAIARPIEKRAVVEVKSKDKDKYKKIMNDRGDEAEVLQGMMLANLAKVDKLIMAYVFFTREQENIMRDYISKDVANGIEIDKIKVTDFQNDHKRWTYKSVIIELMEFEVEDLSEKMNQAYSELEQFKETNRIPEKYFSREERAYLNEICGRVVEEQPLF